MTRDETVQCEQCDVELPKEKARCENYPTREGWTTVYFCNDCWGKP